MSSESSVSSDACQTEACYNAQSENSKWICETMATEPEK